MLSKKGIVSAIISLLFFSVAFKGGEGEKFPEITGTTLEDKKVTIPEDTKGKYTLIGIAYSRKAEKDLQSWFSPAYNTFIREPEEKSLFHVDYNVNVYFIPMFTGVKKLAANKAKKEAKENIDEVLYSHVLFYKGNMGDYKDQLGMQDRTEPHFFVLDKKGNVVHKTSGYYTDKKIIKIENIVDPREAEPANGN